MESWPEAIGASVALLTAAGGVLKWTVDQFRQMHKEAMASAERLAATFASALAEERALTVAERDARLKDKDQSIRDMREMLDQFSQTLRELKSSRSIPPS